MGQAMHDLGIERMPLEQRIALVQEIWDTVAVDAGLPVYLYCVVELGNAYHLQGVLMSGNGEN